MPTPTDARRRYRADQRLRRWVRRTICIPVWASRDERAQACHYAVHVHFSMEPLYPGYRAHRHTSQA